MRFVNGVPTTWTHRAVLAFVASRDAKRIERLRRWIGERWKRPGSGAAEISPGVRLFQVPDGRRGIPARW